MRHACDREQIQYILLFKYSVGSLYSPQFFHFFYLFNVSIDRALLLNNDREREREIKKKKIILNSNQIPNQICCAVVHSEMTPSVYIFTIEILFNLEYFFFLIISFSLFYSLLEYFQNDFICDPVISYIYSFRGRKQ